MAMQTLTNLYLIHDRRKGRVDGRSQGSGRYEKDPGFIRGVFEKIDWRDREIGGGGVYGDRGIEKRDLLVGAVDWNIRDFHGYSTPSGTTYNAYLILDGKNVLVDTVKAPFYLEMMVASPRLLILENRYHRFKSCRDGPLRFAAPGGRTDWKPCRHHFGARENGVGKVSPEIF